MNDDNELSWDELAERLTQNVEEMDEANWAERN